MAISADQYSNDDASKRTNAEADQDTDATEPLAVSCMRCGEILPIDAVAPSERDEIECTRCHRVRPITEVLLR